MNTSYTQTAPAPAPPSEPQGGARGTDAGQDRWGGETFDRMLRDKAAERDSDGDPGGAPPGPDAGAVAGSVPPSACALDQTARAKGSPCSPAAGSGMAGEAAGAARAALAATLSNGSAVKTLSDAHAESAQAWAVTLREPLGVSVEMRATRPASADTARGGPQAWSLAISSPALDPATLARHAPRLNERLRARALAPMHLRIDGDDDVPA